MSGGVFVLSRALKIILPECLDEIQVGSDCSNLQERLRQRLFTFTFSCSGPMGLLLSEAQWCWAG